MKRAQHRSANTTWRRVGICAGALQGEDLEGVFESALECAQCGRLLRGGSDDLGWVAALFGVGAHGTVHPTCDAWREAWPMGLRAC